MNALKTSPNISNPDTVYQMLIDAHIGLDDESSMRLNAKIILLLANHIGDQEVLAEALRVASGSKPIGIDPVRNRSNAPKQRP